MRELARMRMAARTQGMGIERDSREADRGRGFGSDCEEEVREDDREKVLSVGTERIPAC